MSIYHEGYLDTILVKKSMEKNISSKSLKAHDHFDLQFIAQIFSFFHALNYFTLALIVCNQLQQSSTKNSFLRLYDLTYVVCWCASSMWCPDAVRPDSSCSSSSPSDTGSSLSRDICDRASSGSGSVKSGWCSVVPLGMTQPVDR